ncbi:unnamed protein product [Trichobilharzia szidati]|nr:unnamed protein product [Trichobilharzia szidati]
MAPWRTSKSLSKDQLNRLLEHKYHCEGGSICDSIFKDFWLKSSLYVPTYIAPNTLTLIGLLANLFSICLLLIYGAGPITSLLFAVCVFIYQTLDALDGLHARRTGSSSQLGELFDHGCDAISTCILPIGYFITIGFNDWPVLMFIQYFCIQSLFYLAHWRCYVTGILSFDRVGVTEGLVIGMVTSMITSIFGSSFWSIKDPIFSIEFRVIQFLAFSAFMLLIIVQFGGTISKGGCGKYGATIANTSILFPFCPLAFSVGLAVVVAVNSPINLYHQSPFIFLLTFGFIVVKVSQRLVIAHMTKSSINLFDTVMFGAALLLVNQYFKCPFNEFVILWLSMIFGFVNVMLYDADICIQLADFLNIYIFHVGRPANTRQNAKNPSVNSSVQQHQDNAYRHSNRARNNPQHK